VAVLIGSRLVAFGHGLGWIPGADEESKTPPVRRRALARLAGGILIAAGLAIFVTLILGALA
jgi:hypothetical protein